MTEKKHSLDRWYQHAARTDGFIGAALRAQRVKAFQTQEQQRSQIGILDQKYDRLWRRLQALPLPRTDHFAADLERLTTRASEDLHIATTINLAQLEKLIGEGLP